MIDRYTAAIVQFRRIDPEQIPDVIERKKANLKKMLGTFESLETWDVISPVKLVLLPENIFRHEFNAKESTQTERVASAVEIPGPETDEIAEMARGASQDFIRKVAQEVAADGIWVSTTFALLPDLPQQIYHLEETLARMPEVKYLNPWIYNAKWDPKKNEWPERAEKEDMAWVPLYIDMVEKMLVALKDAGALLLSGTDAAIPFIVPGFGLHDELEALVSIGFSPYDALRTSTYNPAKYLGALRELGTVKVGKRADIVVLEGNPLEDINNTRKINGVMVRGRWFARGDLDLMLELVADANLGND